MALWLPAPDVMASAQFSHLSPFVFVMAADMPQLARLSVLVSFGHHTYSRSITADDDPKWQLGPPNDRRCFCPERHALSFGLPDAIRRAAEGRVYFSQDWRLDQRNFLIIETGQGAPYIAAFNLVRARQVNADLAMFVVSAYVRENLKVSRLERIKFRTLAQKIASGVPVHRPPKSK